MTNIFPPENQNFADGPQKEDFIKKVQPIVNQILGSIDEWTKNLSSLERLFLFMSLKSALEEKHDIASQEIRAQITQAQESIEKTLKKKAIKIENTKTNS